MRSAVLAGFLLAVSAPKPIVGQGLPVRSAPITDVRYDVTFDSATAVSHTLNVSMSFRTAGTDPVLLSLPDWTPGAYEISYFARDVEDFTATAGRDALRWDKVSFDTWRVWPGGPDSVTVAFTYVADTLDNAMAWSQPDFLLFNGTNIFLYPEGQPFDFPAQVTVHTQAGWQIATSMHRVAAPATFTAPTYHDLVDMPMFVGRFDLDSSEIDGHWYRLVTYPTGAMHGAGRNEFWTEMRQFMPPLIAVTGDVPWDVYTVMMIFSPTYPGGSALEHQNSHVGVYNPAIIGMTLLASMSAHEIFHAWNVKRLRPAAMWPYDYAHPQPARLLWVSEGITDYYADLALVRGGVISPDDFYGITAGKMRSVDAAPATGLEDASLTTWIHPVDGSEYLYYDKGSLAGFLLDVLIRDASDNHASLDTVMRDLYNTFYKAGKGFSEDDWWRAVSRAAQGKSFDAFYRRYVDGREPFPYATVLPLAGLVLHADTIRVPQLGTRTLPDSGAVVVTNVVSGSAADSAGVEVGDHLLKVGAVDVHDLDAGENAFRDAFRLQFLGRAAGTPFPIVVERHGNTHALTARLRLGETVMRSLVVDPRASPKAARIRQGIVRGSLAP
jgi:predicted metalloprotease with PDZ domain